MSVIDRPVQFKDDAASAAPGVDIVLSTHDSRHLELFDARTVRLVGALHRRFWDRRRDMLLRRAQSGTTSAVEGQASSVTWEDRVSGLLERTQPDQLVNEIELRGWVETEPAVLVDGRAVPGCVLDLAVLLGAHADHLRLEDARLEVTLPTPQCDDEKRLSADLVNIAQDRAGIDRGTVVLRYV